MENKTPNNNQNEKKKDTKRNIIIIIAVIVLIISGTYIGYYIYNMINANKEYDSITTTVATTSETVKNPIDFASLKAQNDEIYAWIKVPNTDIDYPICQSATDDEFYLKRSALDKKWLASGAIYTESCNSTNFNDPITVIYGHNGYSETMFTTLHKFEDKEFFDQNDKFTIYTENSILTYQVISAFKYDNRHIMNSFDFSKIDDLNEFQETIKNPSSALKNVRTDLEADINEYSKIVVLSTCITGQKSNRFLVCGVLVKNEKTN